MAERPWDTRPLRQCGKWLCGGTPARNRADYWGGEIPWISAKSLTSILVRSSDEMVTELGARNGTRIVGTGTILFVVRGMSLKSEFRLGFTQRPVTFNQDLKALVPSSDFIPPFVAHYLKFREPDILGMVDEAGHGTGRLPTDRISALSIPCPPLDEQRAIASALSDVDALIVAQEKLIAKKRAIKTAMMQQLLTDKRRFPGFSSAWKSKPIGDLVLDGPKNGFSGRASDSAKGTPTLRLSATTSGTLVLNESTTKCLEKSIKRGSDLFLRPGDLLVQRSNTLELVGTAAVYTGPPDLYVYPDLMMRLRFDCIETSCWIQLYLNSKLGRTTLQALAAGSTGTMPKISGRALKDVVVPWPAADERSGIVRIFSDMDAEIAALEARLRKTRDIKQGMMQELLTGRTRLV